MRYYMIIDSKGNIIKDHITSYEKALKLLDSYPDDYDLGVYYD